jgi:hypothetical protein
MKAILWLNEVVNQRAPTAKRLIRLLIPKRLQSRFAAKKFAMTIEDEDYAKTFTNIHSKNWWGSSESVSGYGSQLDRTVTIRRELPSWIKATAINSIFDAPCGDFNLVNAITQSTKVRYLGGDIVNDIVSTNNSRFATERVSFVVFDILRDTLPDTDAWLCRDVLFHFPNHAIATILARFLESGIRFFLASHFTDTIDHPDIQFGGYRPVNLCQPPFNWPKPLILIFDGDGGSESDRYLAVWENPNVGAARQGTN